ncbi:MAG TPA: FAD-binding oxidoreductase [Gemmatimonadales bacterium]|nr:FAD-binding oxidoreductase [Gemmatimonadales bacterium]
MTVSASPTGFRGSYLTDERSRGAYSEGAGPLRIVPRAVAVPLDREDLELLLRWAADGGIPLVPRGAGSGMPGGNIGTGVVVDLHAFDRPASVSLAMTANVGAAITWATLDEVASHFHFRLPPDPSSGAFCTLGGMVSTNAAGARSLRSGSIRAWVRGVEVVTADGESGWLSRGSAREPRKVKPGSRRHLVERLQAEDRFAPVRTAITAAAPLIGERFPRTRKNSSGYALDHYLETGDLVDLVVGAEGTLGFVTRVELQLERRPEAVGALLVGLSDLDALAGVVQTLMGFDPAAVELLDRTFLDFTRPDTDLPMDRAAAVVLVEFERGTPGAVIDAVTEAERAVHDMAAFTRTGIGESERESIWTIRHGASVALAARGEHSRSLQIVEDGCVPVAALGEYVRGVRAAARDAGVEIVAFGHAGDGHLHVNAIVDPADADVRGRLARLYDDVTALLVRLGGTTTGEHGDGRLRAPALERIYGPEVVTLFRQVKEAFDPAGIMNPGVILETRGFRPLDHLKIGADAEPVPDDVAASLRRTERAGAWGTPPLERLEAAS